MLSIFHYSYTVTSRKENSTNTMCIYNHRLLSRQDGIAETEVGSQRLYLIPTVGMHTLLLWHSEKLVWVTFPRCESTHHATVQPQQPWVSQRELQCDPAGTSRVHDK